MALAVSIVAFLAGVALGALLHRHVGWLVRRTSSVRERHATAHDPGPAELLEVADEEIKKLEGRLATALARTEDSEDARINTLADLEELQDHVERQRFRRRHPTVTARGGAAEASWGVPRHVHHFAALRPACEAHLPRVAFPEAALRGEQLLEAAIESRAWAQATWTALRALDEYAGRAADFQGSFWNWCEQGDAEFAWPATSKKLAMVESDAVMEKERLREFRMLPVDELVDPSGRTLMVAHIKISVWGGALSPRLYFYDDTKGGTGKVHVGFLGPHRLMPNSRTN